MTAQASPERTSTISWLRKLRDQYSNEVPPLMVHSTSQTAASKVRGSWWLLLDLVLEHAAAKHLFGAEFAGKVRRFADRITRDDFAARPRTATDVDMGNRIIAEALHELEERM